MTSDPKAILVLNGSPPLPERLRELAAAFPVYAADGGAWICMEAGVRPEWVAGDLDSSVREQVPKDWEIRHYPEQTRTDFQKVLADLPPEVERLLILGGLGLRTDHLLTNLMIAAALPAGLRICFENGAEQLIRVTPERPFAESPAVGETLSLIPMPEAEGVTTQGLRWNLQEAVLKVGGQLGQSNEVTGPVEIRVAGGCLFVWRLRRSQ